MKELIRARAGELGFDACRFTTANPPASGDALGSWLAEGMQGEMGYLARNGDKRRDPNLVLAGARSIITLATNYLPPHPPVSAERPTAQPGGQIARYARYPDYHNVLAKPLSELTAYLQTLFPPPHRSLWYVDTGPLLERDLAQRAGVGFVGKHTNLISRQLGNWFFLSEIITTAELEPDPPEVNRCGSCTRCLTACPTQAIVQPFKLDARRCISYLTIELKGPIPLEFREALGNRIYGCDDCLAACPWNRFAQSSRMMADRFEANLELPNLLQLLELDDAGFKEMFAGTPMIRTKRRGLLRNVCVALGNVGDASALPALQRANRDAEPLIAEHATWAINRIQTRLASGPGA